MFGSFLAGPPRNADQGGKEGDLIALLLVFSRSPMPEARLPSSITSSTSVTSLTALLSLPRSGRMQFVMDL